MNKQDATHYLAILAMVAVMIIGMAKFTKYVDSKADQFYATKYAKKGK